jgi:hypothetical protein
LEHQRRSVGICGVRLALPDTIRIPSQVSHPDCGIGLHQEYWIPATELEEFNNHIDGTIELIASFRP